MIQIMKASAGSGKTFNLAKTYITILLESEERYAYRGILAVTFTNKATAEMKNRILKELRILSTEPRKSGYYKDFVPSLFQSDEKLRRKAEGILVDILHDYGAFSISTIDRFFQQTLKAFSREIGQFSSYQIELDKKSLVHESVDRILDALTSEDVHLVEWLDASVSEQLERGDKVNLEGGLYEMAERLSSEDHGNMAEKYGILDDVFSKKNLEIIRKECRSIIRNFESDLQTAAGAVADVMSAAGVPLEETNRKFLVAVRNYVAVKPGQAIKKPSDSFFSKSSDSDLWFAKSKADKYLPYVRTALQDPLGRFCDLFDAPFRAYNTARLLSSQVYGLGLAGEFYKEFSALLKEKNVLSIDDSNTILRKIIDGSDAPFVYEKLGVRFSHFLLDEFQDTSTVQWSNFLPLLKESDSSGNANLVVGDVKQSIYRWRGSEWDLLDSGVTDSFPRAEVKALKENWRSSRTVVNFNNDFFKFASEALEPTCAGADFSIKRIYDDVCQTPKSSEKQSGCVRVSFCDKDEEIGKVVEDINSIRDAGAEWGDIAVLVRNNKEGGDIASSLIDNGIPVLSDDSLDVKSSVTVRRVVALLNCVDNPDDKLNSFLASELDVAFPDHYHSLVDLCESLLRGLRTFNPALFDGEILYIQSFMDAVQDWTARNGNNLTMFLKFWKDTSLSVSSPADSDAVRIMTIHKSKGLEFPHVIFPFAEKVSLWGKSCRWCHPEEGYKGLEAASKAIYPVDLNSSACDTAFSKDYEKERSLQVVDAINTFYVALTRAEKSLHVIACTPSAKLKDEVASATPSSFTDFSQILYAYVRADGYVAGEGYDFKQIERKNSDDIIPLQSAYPSIPLNPEILPEDGETGAGERGRLKFSADSSDFFAADGTAGVRASNRLNGIVLHSILSRVETSEMLDAAVAEAVDNAELTAVEGEDALELLSNAISAPEVRPWFDGGRDGFLVERERPVIDTDGSVYRPDRVVHAGGSTVVVDFKFGERKPSHLRQVARYVDIYSRMGYADVHGYLWYVQDNLVEPVR